MVKLQKSMEDLELLQMYESLIDCLNSTMIFKEFFKVHLNFKIVIHRV